MSKLLKPVSVLFLVFAFIATIGASPSSALEVGSEDEGDMVCKNINIGYPDNLPYVLIGSWIANNHDNPCEKFAPHTGYSDFTSEELAFRPHGRCSDAASDEVIKYVCSNNIRIQQSDLEDVQDFDNSSIFAFLSNGKIITPGSGERSEQNLCINNKALDVWANTEPPEAQYAIGESCLYRE